LNPEEWEAYTTPLGRVRYRPKTESTDTSAPARTLVGCFQWLEERLSAAGWPRTSPWWQERVQGFLEGSKRQAVFRVGRRGGKTTTMCRMGLVLTLWGGHVVPPGDIGWLVVVSLKREFAEDVVQVMTRILDAVGIRHDPLQGDARGMRIPGTRYGIRVLTASVGGVVSMTTVCAICDEIARWKDSETLVNPATQVLASLRPTMATQPKARMVLISSPLGLLDAHAAEFERGNTDHQMVAHAPTWIANPTLTEEWTRADEPNEDMWRREYAAIPIEGLVSSLISPASIDACTRKGGPVTVPREEGVSYVAAMDPAMRGNGWTLGIMGRRILAGVPRRSLVHVREWRGSSSSPLDPRRVLSEICTELLAYNLGCIWTDQREYDSLRAIGDGLGIILQQDVMTAGLKEERAIALERALATGELELPEHAVLRRDLLGVTRAVTANGMVIRLADTPDGRHCDYAAMLMILIGKYSEAPIMPETRTPAQIEQQQALEHAQERYGRRSTNRGRTRTPGSDGQFGRGW
jgi:hypothetical protein